MAVPGANHSHHVYFFCLELDGLRTAWAKVGGARVGMFTTSLRDTKFPNKLFDQKAQFFFSLFFSPDYSCSRTLLLKSERKEATGPSQGERE